jgi:hypothetical protein
MRRRWVIKCHTTGASETVCHHRGVLRTKTYILSTRLCRPSDAIVSLSEGITGKLLGDTYLHKFHNGLPLWNRTIPRSSNSHAGRVQFTCRSVEGWLMLLTDRRGCFSDTTPGPTTMIIRTP